LATGRTPVVGRVRESYVARRQWPDLSRCVSTVQRLRRRRWTADAARPIPQTLAESNRLHRDRRSRECAQLVARRNYRVAAAPRQLRRTRLVAIVVLALTLWSHE